MTRRGRTTTSLVALSLPTLTRRCLSGVPAVELSVILPSSGAGGGARENVTAERSAKRVAWIPGLWVGALIARGSRREMEGPRAPNGVVDRWWICCRVAMLDT